ncbi:hypothetical protein U1707_02020 [Sphingomonas sp. PB2P12]|uniref:hypothetical protein n=1 Tax=Sphingomonas sandaracina TaxID=3096157 RepID=UPI002FC9ACFE
MADQYDRYKIPIDGRWTLEDLYRFPRAYEQVYFAFEAISPSETVEVEERLTRAFEAFPWRGGYSAVSFYNQLKFATPIQRRPTVTRIQYASPGLIELYLSLPLAVHIGSVVSSVAASIGVCNKVYNSIHIDLQKRKLLRIEVGRKQLELSREEFYLVKEMSETMATMLDIGTAQFLHERTKDPLKSLKILLSVFRRVKTLAEFKLRGKADLRSVNQLASDGDL